MRRDGERLVFSGALERSACASLWKQAQPLLGEVRTLDLSATSQVDSAGLALLAELASRSGGVAVVGAPAGLAELRAAYRLDHRLAFAS
ncbi:MAG TPA: STAS domain-containing protein [Lysobacter sp.]|nr:STAS domain-containing protein [Lysobacter sp.]